VYDGAMRVTHSAAPGPSGAILVVSSDWTRWCRAAPAGVRCPGRLQRGANWRPVDLLV